MGIQGLLQKLEPIVERQQALDKYAGQRIGVDASVWLHRGTYACATELFRGMPTTRHVDYCMKLVSLLIDRRITPVLVFDGGSLPAKAQTAAKRRKLREDALAKAHEAQREIEALKFKVAKERPRSSDWATIQNALVQAQKDFDELCQACTEVTPEHARELILRLRSRGVEYVVAPYEADAQLAFFARTGKIDGVLSEDSDMVAYGCPKILLKLDRNAATVDELRTDRLQEVGANGEAFDLRRFTPEAFTQMCIFSGVDYLASPKGLGLLTARKLLLQYKSAERVIKVLRQTKGIDVPAEYAASFRKANLTFRHQRVFDAEVGALVPLTPLPDDIELSPAELDEVIGPSLPPEVALGIARGELHPKTHRPWLASARGAAWRAHAQPGEAAPAVARGPAPPVVAAASPARSDLAAPSPAPRRASPGAQLKPKPSAQSRALIESLTQAARVESGLPGAPSPLRGVAASPGPRERPLSLAAALVPDGSPSPHARASPPEAARAAVAPPSAGRGAHNPFRRRPAAPFQTADLGLGQRVRSVGSAAEGVAQQLDSRFEQKQEPASPRAASPTAPDPSTAPAEAQGRELEPARQGPSEEWACPTCTRLNALTECICATCAHMEAAPHLRMASASAKQTSTSGVRGSMATPAPLSAGARGASKNKAKRVRYGKGGGAPARKRAATPAGLSSSIRDYFGGRGGAAESADGPNQAP